MNRATPRTAFSFSELEGGFEEELMLLIRRLLDAERSKYINPQNALSYSRDQSASAGMISGLLGSLQDQEAS